MSVRWRQPADSIYFVAGEASGDNHGAALMQALRRLQPDLQLLGRGGPRMKADGGRPISSTGATKPASSAFGKW